MNELKEYRGELSLAAFKALINERDNALGRYKECRAAMEKVWRALLDAGVDADQLKPISVTEAIQQLADKQAEEVPKASDAHRKMGWTIDDAFISGIYKEVSAEWSIGFEEIESILCILARDGYIKVSK